MATKKKATKAASAPKSKSPIRVGNKVFIRTVTYHYTGEIVEVTPQDIVLAKVAWIADSGIFSQAMSTGALNEVEPYPDTVTVSVSRGASVDVSDWPHELPRTRK